MASLESSVFVSVFLALILLFANFFILSNVPISIYLIVVFIGFVASAMAGSENNSYRVGGIAGSVLAVMFFIINFVTAPTLTFDLYGLNYDALLMTEGFVLLMLSFVLSLAIFMLLGAFGGLIAEQLFGSDDESSGKQENSKPYKY
ncbi:MAG: hypothetical protein ACP5OJ_05295 [Methanothermobacter sp.]